MNIRSFDEERKIHAAYIITLGNNSESVKLTERCIEYCESLGMEYKTQQGFDGTGDYIVVPEGMNKQSWISLFRVPSNVYSNSQIACFLSHLSLWIECVEIGKPIVILEHDAVMVKKIEYAKFYNCIQFLGCYEQVQETLPVIDYIPPHASIFDGTWRSICRAHAYLIDPPIARQMIAEVIKYGMVKTLDIFLRSDIFPIVQDDLYAYDLRGESTIKELNGNERDQ